VLDVPAADFPYGVESSPHIGDKG
jgi:hypothetical protein